MRYREYMVDGDTEAILLILQNKMGKLICLATGFWGLEAVCRISPTPSQQVGEYFARLFGIGLKSP